MNKDQFVRYKTLDECFRNVNGTFTIDDLIEECDKALKAYHPGEEQVHVSRRTIEKDLSDLQARYGLVFQKGQTLGHKKIYRYEDTSYSLKKELLDDKDLEQMMLQGVLDTLSMYDNVPQYQWLYAFIQERIHGSGADGTKLVSFDNNESLVGMDKFGLLMNAILRKQPLDIDYKPYGKDVRTYKVHPYLLKQFNGRWFLIARTEQHPLSNFPLDRIKNARLIQAEFMPPEVDLNEYYQDVVGVSRNVDSPIEEVLIRIDKKRYEYVRTKKLHASQNVIMHMSDNQYTVIRLQVLINKELESAILALGSDAEVLVPESLRNNIKEKIIQLYEKYT